VLHLPHTKVSGDVHAFMFFVWLSWKPDPDFESMGATVTYVHLFTCVKVLVWRLPSMEELPAANQAGNLAIHTQRAPSC